MRLSRLNPDRPKHQEKPVEVIPEITDEKALELIAKGGNAWKGVRVYLSGAAEAILTDAGYSFRRYKSGNIAEARNADGDKISNSKMQGLISSVSHAYYDITKKAFVGFDIDEL